MNFKDLEKYLVSNDNSLPLIAKVLLIQWYFVGAFVLSYTYNRAQTDFTYDTSAGLIIGFGAIIFPTVIFWTRRKKKLDKTSKKKKS